jgi:preprotein translocase subunit SecG
MVEFQVADALLRRFNAAVTIIVFATVVGLAYWYERAYRRWAEQQHPFAAPAGPS